MSEVPLSYECRACGRRVALAVNRCPSCRTLGRMVASSAPPEKRRPRVRPLGRKSALPHFEPTPTLISKFAALGRTLVKDGSPSAAPVIERLADIEAEDRDRLETKNPILDAAFGRRDAPGIAERSCTIFAGQPGTYKTTLVLEALASIAHHYERDTLVLQAEMAARFCREYAERIGLFRRFPRARAHLLIVEVETVGAALAAIDDAPAPLFAIDSLQKVCFKEKTNVIDAAVQFNARCEKSPEKPARTGILIGHGTKDGDMSGTMAAMHEVDALFLLEFFDPITLETLAPKHRKDVMRLCSLKNRFSDAAGIVGTFDLKRDVGPVANVDSLR